MGRFKKSDFVNAKDLFAALPADRRAAIEARTKVLMAEHLTLQDIRKARTLTQAQLAKKLGIGQEQISRLESRADMLLSTLSGYVEAMGGTLKLVAQFPDRAPVTIARLLDVFDDLPDQEPLTPRRRRVTKKVLPAKRQKALVKA